MRRDLLWWPIVLGGCAVGGPPPDGAPAVESTAARVPDPDAGAATVAFAGRGQPAFAEESPQRAIEERWGLQFCGVRISAGGRLVDLRYEISDAERARPLFASGQKPVLIDEASGARLEVPNPPKVGPLWGKGGAEVGRTYYMLFGNQSQKVQPGSRVTLVLGDLRAEHLFVE